MRNNRELEVILNKFSTNLKESEKRNGLEEKLRRHAESIREVQGVASNSILTQGNTSLFLKLLSDSQQTKIQYQDVLCTDLDKRHDMLLRFDSGRCIVESTLLPSPFVVSETIPIEPVDYCIMNTNEFFGLMRIIKIFGGRRVTIEKKKVGDGTRSMIKK